MKDNVPLEVEKERLQRLNKKVGIYILNLSNEVRYEGKIVTVLCEGSSKDENVLAGYTDKNICNFKDQESIGKLVDVKIDEANNITLNGTFIQEHQRSMVQYMYSEKKSYEKSKV